jgi:hypothetical protein
MKKRSLHPLIIFLRLHICIQLVPGRKNYNSCNKELLLKTPGRWMSVDRFTWNKISKRKEQEILKRLETLNILSGLIRTADGPLKKVR